MNVDIALLEGQHLISGFPISTIVFIYRVQGGGRSNILDGHDKDNVPALKLIQNAYIQVPGGVTRYVVDTACYCGSLV